MNRWVLGARPRTLPAAVVPVVVGTAAAAGPAALGWDRGITWWRALCALLVALSVQVATNYANDYSDGVRGTDDPDRRVGPPRLVGGGLATPSEVKRATLAAFGVTLLAGVPLVLLVDPRLALVGVAAVAAGWFYTGGPRPYGYAGLGELFVFTFFGVVATVGSTYVQLERVTALSLWCSVGVGALATALLVVNNLRDIPGDTASGKRTLAVRLGDQRTRVLFLVLMAVPYLVVPVVAGRYRIWAVLALVALPVARRAALPVVQGARGAALVPVLVATGRVQLLYGALLAGGLWASA